jgi:general secretion pathway protein G
LTVLKASQKRGTQGFTLIELLIVVAIIGVIAAILIPNLLDSLQKSKQKRTMVDMREIGSAWFSWLTDQIGAASAGQGQGTWDFEDLGTTLTAAELQTSLYINENMFYIRSVPTRDGWGRDYDFRYSGSPLADKTLGIRSRGRDGAEGPGNSPYNIGPFVATDYDQDIVWSDGLFIRYPAGVKSEE